MGRKISILIVDDIVEYVNTMKELIENEDDLEVAGIARDGEEALRQIYALSPDFVLLDAMMPSLDGLGVLERIAENKDVKKPLIIVVSSLSHDYFIKRFLELGADYYIVKPFSWDNLVSHIRQIYNCRFNSSITDRFSFFRKLPEVDKQRTGFEVKVEKDVTSLMNRVGISPHITGYNYIREAVIKAVYDFRSLSPLKRVLYPVLAEKFGTNSIKVERSIKNAIKNAWSKEGNNPNEVLFGKASNNKGKPTNMEFIALMADKIRVMNKADDNNNMFAKTAENCKSPIK